MSYSRSRATVITGGLVLLVCLVGLGLVVVNGLTLAGGLAWLILGLLPAVLILRAFGGALPAGVGLATDRVNDLTPDASYRSGGSKGARGTRR